MGFDIGTVAQDIAGQATGAILGLALEGHNDRRQLRQQEKLQNLQIKGSKELTDYNQQKQLDMWHKTNYSAQMMELEKAGLNPGLIYGMSGGGGVTTGSANGNVSGAQAPSGGGEAMGMMMQSMQLRQIDAQIKLAESQANKNNVEATKTAGIDTDLATTQRDSLVQGIQNQKAVEALTKADTFLKEIEGSYQKGSLQDRLDFTNYNASRALAECDKANNEAFIARGTRENQINIIKQAAIEGVLKNVLIEAQTDATRQNIKESQSKVEVNNQQIKNMAQQILQGWTGLDQSKTKNNIEQFKAEFQAQFPNLHTVLGKFADDIYRTIGEIGNMEGISDKRVDRKVKH